MVKSRNICIIYTETNGLHSTHDDVVKKNLYSIARLVVLNYEIGYRENNKFISTKKVRSLIKPRCMNISEESFKIHGITMEEAEKEGLEIESVLKTFYKDLADVSIIISHNIEFHMKTLIGESVRYNIIFTFKNFIIIDTISFYHKESYPKLEVLYEKLSVKKKSSKKLSNLEMIRICFLGLYEAYETCVTNQNI
jgi:DNA polymerase III epsilon subunit-like protein